MIDNITITTEQWIFAAMSLIAFSFAFVLICLILKENKKKFTNEPYIRLVKKNGGFYLNFNLNEVNEMRKFNDANKPITCHVIPINGRSVFFEGFLLEAFIDHVQGGYAPELFDVSAQTKLHNAKKRIEF